MTENRSALAATEERQIREIEAALAELDAGLGVSHQKVSKWLKSWGKTGKPGETKAPK